MSRKKHILMTTFILFSLSFISFHFIFGAAQTSEWTYLEITSNSGTAPIVDGKKDDLWSLANFSSYEFGDKEISLYVLHDINSIYFLIEAKFETSQENESVSLFLSSSNKSSEIFDKKQITMVNLSQSGNNYIIYEDYYQIGENFQKDNITGDGFIGNASINQENQFRLYEFKININPSNATASEDVTIKGFSNFAIQIALDSVDSSGVTFSSGRSSTLLIQVGPKASVVDDTIGEYNLNTQLYILIVLISVSVIFTIFGIVLFTTSNKELKILEEKN